MIIDYKCEAIAFESTRKTLTKQERDQNPVAFVWDLKLISFSFSSPFSSICNALSFGVQSLTQPVEYCFKENEQWVQINGQKKKRNSIGRPIIITPITKFKD